MKELWHDENSLKAYTVSRGSKPAAQSLRIYRVIIMESFVEFVNIWVCRLVPSMSAYPVKQIFFLCKLYVNFPTWLFRRVPYHFSCYNNNRLQFC